MYLKLSEKFLFSQGLCLDHARTSEIEQIGKTVLAPTVRVNYGEVAKLMTGHPEERAQVAACLATIFEVLGQVLSQSSACMVHIDLGLLGIVSALQQAVFVVPYQKVKAEIHSHHKGKVGAAHSPSKPLWTCFPSTALSQPDGASQAVCLGLKAILSSNQAPLWPSSSLRLLEARARRVSSQS